MDYEKEDKKYGDPVRKLLDGPGMVCLGPGSLTEENAAEILKSDEEAFNIVAKLLQEEFEEMFT